MGLFDPKYDGPPHVAADWRNAVAAGEIRQEDIPKNAILPDQPVLPDLTDDQVRGAALMQRRRLLLGANSSWLSGPLGDQSTMTAGAATAGGK